MAIAQTTIIDYVRARGMTTSEVSDADIGTLILVALEEYSAFRPNKTFTSSSGYITTVANTPSYDFPANAISIISVFWQPDYTDVALDAVYADMLLGLVDATHPIDIMIEFDRIAQLRHYYGGSWKILNGKIWLVPTPGISGTKVPIIYATQHTLSSLNSIEDNLFLDLIYCYCLEKKAIYHLNDAGFRAGSYSKTGTAGQVLLQSAQRQMDLVRTRLAASAPSGSAMQTRDSGRA